tara:strand:- start:188 stop:364 length:177 start_codon:yes stop_codon:yes gene_type:complete
MNKTVSKFLEEQAAGIALKMDEIGKSETPNLADYHFLTALMMSIQYLIETNGKASKKN